MSGGGEPEGEEEKNGRRRPFQLLPPLSSLLSSRDPTGQTALHWAAVRGCVATGDALVRAGADPGAADSRGYTPAHVAAQHARPAFLLRAASAWAAPHDAGDGDGRTPLTWAAYKGAGDATRVLLALGADPLAADAERATPLHWAALRGSEEAATLLLHGGAGAALGAADGTGATPAALARSRGHGALAVRLDAAAKARAKAASLAKAPGAAGAARRFFARAELAPATLALIATLVAAFELRVVRMAGVLPPTEGWVRGGAVAVALAAAAGLAAAAATAAADPGVVPRPGRARGDAKRRRGAGGARPATDDGAALADARAALAAAGGAWHRLCVACRVVRPVRAKHCAVLGRCVHLYDHRCPWVGATIGGGNRPLFLLFVALELFAAALAAVIAVARLRDAAAAAAAAPDLPAIETATRSALLAGAFLIVDLVALLPVAALAATHAHQVSVALTTNEAVNRHRYPYLRDGDSRFTNPHDAGCAANWRAALRRETGPPGPGDREMLLLGGVGRGSSAV